jgi:hypothetical protein
MTTIIACDFRYSEFENCYVEYRYLKGSLPSEPNLRRYLVRNLALQCLKKVILKNTEIISLTKEKQAKIFI